MIVISSKVFESILKVIVIINDLINSTISINIKKEDKHDSLLDVTLCRLTLNKCKWTK